MDEHQTFSFKAAFERLAPLFAVMTVCMHVYVWLRYQDLKAFLDNMFLHLAPLLAAHAYLAFLASNNYVNVPVCSEEDSEVDAFGWNEDLCVNPHTGAPMIGGIGGIDATGYTYGSGPSEP